jgi:hypothetical protein
MVQYLSNDYAAAARTFQETREIASPAGFEELALTSELYLAAIAYPDTKDATHLRQLRDGVRRLSETYLEIPARRLLGDALTRGATDEELRQEGRGILVDAKKRAGQLPYPLEEKLIERVLNSLGQEI